MGTALVYDVESSGLPLFREPSDDPRQPHLAQVAAALCDEDGCVRCSMNLLVRQDGWTCEPEALAAHGITPEIADRFGVNELSAFDTFWDLAGDADLLVGHNESFDRRLIRIASRRFGQGIEEAWAAKNGCCTMKAATQLCALPPTERMIASGRNWFKAPKLEEALEILCGEKLEGAHDAWADCQGARRLWLELRRRGVL